MPSPVLMPVWFGAALYLTCAVLAIFLIVATSLACLIWHRSALWECRCNEARKERDEAVAALESLRATLESLRKKLAALAGRID